VPPFAIDDPARSAKKYVVAQIVKADDGGEYTLSDFRNQIREQLAQERGMRRVSSHAKSDANATASAIASAVASLTMDIPPS
jgi:hypothetical protein